MDFFESIRDHIRVKNLVLAGACGLAAGAMLLGLGTVVLGQLGDGIEVATVGLFGLAAWACPFVLGWYGVKFARNRPVTALVVSADAACGFAASLALGATLDRGGAIGNALGRLATSLLMMPGALFIAASIVALALSARWGFGPRSTALPTARAKAAEGLRSIDTSVQLVPIPVSGGDAAPRDTALWMPVAAPTVAVANVIVNEIAHASTAPSIAAVAEVATPVTPVPPVRATRNLRAVKTSSSLPSIDLLDAAVRQSSLRDVASEDGIAETLVRTLADHNVVAKVEEIVPGPQVTTFEVSIAPGTKVSRVLGLSEEISFGLGRKVRALVSPTAGRIGFEVPNATRRPVCLRELLVSEGQGELPMAFGLDVRGGLVTADLASMPHVVVAGSTGSGKSVGLNAMILSMLFKRNPSEVRFVMIDCKQVELTPFAGIPHLLRPVITDAAEAASALGEVVEEMERRFALLSAAGAKNLASYNSKVQDSERLPRIVVIVDEFADLIAQQGKDKSVENAVQRLGQKARAAGIHLVICTQRPSVDVISGSIKANVPGRVAFRVAQAVDSRVVLDQQGAEDLLGRGDALVQLGDGNEMRRVQFANVTEQEVERVVSHLRGSRSASLLRGQS